MNTTSTREKIISAGPAQNVYMPAIVPKNTNDALRIVAKPAEDPELRRKVDARTEYLNSIKLLLS